MALNLREFLFTLDYTDIKALGTNRFSTGWGEDWMTMYIVVMISSNDLLHSLQAFLIQDQFRWTEIWTDGYVWIWMIAEPILNQVWSKQPVRLVRDSFRIGWDLNESHWFWIGSGYVLCLQGFGCFHGRKWCRMQKKNSAHILPWMYQPGDHIEEVDLLHVIFSKSRHLNPILTTTKNFHRTYS